MFTDCIFILFQTVNVEFEGRNPECSDFHSVKQLLQQLFLKAQVNLSDMASLLVNQRSIGSVIKVFKMIYVILWFVILYCKTKLLLTYIKLSL